MSLRDLRARVARLEKGDRSPTNSHVEWENLHRRPEDIVPDDSGIDWIGLFGRTEITDPAAARIAEIEAAVAPERPSAPAPSIRRSPRSAGPMAVTYDSG